MSKQTFFFVQVLHGKFGWAGDAFSSAPLQAQVAFLGVAVSASAAFRITGTQKLSRIIKPHTPGKSFLHGAFASSPLYLSQTAWKLEIQQQFFYVQSILSSSLSSTTDEIWRDLSSHSHQSQPLKRALSIYPMLCLFIHQKKMSLEYKLGFEPNFPCVLCRVCKTWACVSWPRDCLSNCCLGLSRGDNYTNLFW